MYIISLCRSSGVVWVVHLNFYALKVSKMQDFCHAYGCSQFTNVSCGILLMAYQSCCAWCWVSMALARAFTEYSHMTQSFSPNYEVVIDLLEACKNGHAKRYVPCGRTSLAVFNWCGSVQIKVHSLLAVRTRWIHLMMQHSSLLPLFACPVASR